MIESLGGERARIIVFLAFLALVALTGGGARSDIQSLLILRPAAILVAAYGITCATRGQLRSVRVPLLFVVALMLCAILQLVPLPPSLWVSLPDRDLIVDFSNAINMELTNRPVSLDPNRTWNTFFALFVPLAAILLVGIQGRKYAGLVLPSLLTVGAFSVALGMLQLLGARNLYIYELTNIGFPVGLFANRNHQSVFLGWLMLATCFYFAVEAQGGLAKKLGPWIALGAILLLIPLQVLSGSRAGLLLSVPILAVCAWFLARSPALGDLLRRGKMDRKILVSGVLLMVSIPLILIVFSLVQGVRETAFSRAFETNIDQLRFQLFPVLLDMAKHYFPFGSGLGSFEKVYMLHEPTDLLTSRYLNQAHNDLLQLVIEGGGVAVLVLSLSLFWLLRTGVLILRREGRCALPKMVFLYASITVWVFASLVDYPLRTPLLALLIAVLTAELCRISNTLVSDRSAYGGDGYGKRPRSTATTTSRSRMD